jgi:UDP-N-acetylglucosamine 4,6-dehydratase
MFYKIKEVSEKVDCPKSTIRFWEKKFSGYIHPKRTKGGQRIYTEEDIEKFIYIKTLLYRKRKTIQEVGEILGISNQSKTMIDWRNTSILITGGTGSFGRHFTKRMLEEYGPKVIRIYSRDELKQQEMRQTFNDDDRLRFLIGDVRDPDRLHRAMEGADVVIHAAALKQVPSCEYNPFEAVKTNIYGAKNVIDAAIDVGVKKVIAISTDKAVNPINLYGATKLCAEKMFVQGNAYSGPRGTRFSCVRYGNVVGSRGSVIPLFLEQRKNGVITITDERMTRFWITLDEAVEFVIHCLEIMEGGEIFVPKIRSMRIVDLARAIAPECQVQLIGIRAGEKIHEVLITEEDGRNTIQYNGIYVILPQRPSWKQCRVLKGTPLPEGFTYTSNNNDEWLSVEDLREIISNNIKPVEDGSMGIEKSLDLPKNRLDRTWSLNFIKAPRSHEKFIEI